MTAPALDMEALEVLVGAAAWTAHQRLSPEQQVKVDTAWRVYGDVRLVAADVLEAACQDAKRTAASGPRTVKRMKDGAEELEFFAGTSASAEDASAWCQRAADLREAAESSVSAGRGAGAFLPLIEPWGVEL